MRQLHKDEGGGLTMEFAMAVIVISLVCGIWILFNEVVLSVTGVADTQLEYIENNAEDTAAAQVANAPGHTILDALVIFWRILPWAIIVFIWFWAFLRATRREPFVTAGGLIG